MWLHNSYSVEKSIDDLELLLRKLGIRRFHLYGHSFGGMLAYEYIKRIAERKGKADNNEGDDGCLSVILSSAPTSIPVMEAEWDRLLSVLKGDRDNEQASPDELFRITHQCRTKDLPEPLARAFQRVGSTWSGLDVVKGYKLSPPSETATRLPSALVLRGEFDFCTERCTKDWVTLFNHKFVRQKELEGCSHFVLLENGSMYGEVLDSFFSEYD
jgi:proline iminopeptidase